MAKKHSTPHDSLFKATMSHLSEAILFAKTFFPEHIWKNLDFSTFAPYPTSFTDEGLNDHYCDINYTCKWKDREGMVLLSFIFEHKSYWVAFPEIQLLGYLWQGYEYQLKQEKEAKKKKGSKEKKEAVSLIVPVLLYHGEERMKETSFLDKLNVPASFERFYPKFDFIKVDLSEYTDQQLVAIGKTFLTSMLRLFKHKRDKKFLLEYYREIFIFVGSYKNEDTTFRYTETLILYILYTYTIKEKELQEVLEDLPKNISDMFVSTYDMAVEKGIIKGEKRGIEKGIEKGLEKGKLFRSFELVFKLSSGEHKSTPGFLAEITFLPLPVIQSLISQFEKKDKKKAKALMSKELEKVSPLSGKEIEQIDQLFKKYF